MKGTLRDDRNVLCLKWGQIGMYICQNSLKWSLKICAFYIMWLIPQWSWFIKIKPSWESSYYNFKICILENWFYLETGWQTEVELKTIYSSFTSG